jgi:lysophospholipase L1-like esterase
MGATKGRDYPAQLQEMLGSKWTVKNFGVSGRTLMRSGDHPYWKEKAFQSAQEFDPDVVVIMLGTNDTKPHNWEHAGEFYADYKDMVGVFAALPGKPRIYVCRPCPVPAPGNYGINETNIRLEIPIINQLAKELQLGVIDMHAALEDKANLLPDRVHPNTAGAKVMAETVCQALTGKKP